MRMNRPPGAATSRLGASALRAVSVTAVAATALAMATGVASAATAHAKSASTTSVSLSLKKVFVGEAVKLSATVKSSGAPKGTVTFKLDGIKACAAKVSGGKASCRITVGKAGTFRVRGFYSGNATHKASSSGVVKLKEVRAATTTKITKLDPVAVKDGNIVVVTVHVAVPAGAPTATGTVNVAPTNVVAPVDNGYLCTATLVNGTGSCTVAPPTPSYGLVDYQATYAADAARTGSVSATVVLPVEETTTTTVGTQASTVGDVTVTATVVSAGEADLAPPYGSGTVTFYLGSGLTLVKGCEAVSLTNASKGENNVATCTGSSTLNALAAGSYSITAVYSGDDVNLTSTSTPAGTLNLS